MTIEIEHTLSNPGAETGDMTGWTVELGGIILNTGSEGLSAHSGSYFFRGANSLDNRAYQEVDLISDGVDSDHIDNGNADFQADWYQASYSASDKGAILFRFKDASKSEISTSSSSLITISPSKTWQARQYIASIPANTRYIDVIIRSYRIAGSWCDGYFDDISVQATTPDITELVDMSLDIAMWQETCENISTDIHVAQWTKEDIKNDIAAYFQSMVDAPLSVDTLGEVTWNKKIDLFAALQDLKPLPLNVQVAVEQIKNTFLNIYLTDGIIKQDASMDIAIGDGNKIQSLGIDIMAVSTMPEFKSVYAMHLNSAIKEIMS